MRRQGSRSFETAQAADAVVFNALVNAGSEMLGNQLQSGIGSAPRDKSAMTNDKRMRKFRYMDKRKVKSRTAVKYAIKSGI